MGSVQGKDLLLGVAKLQAGSPDSLYKFLAIGTSLVLTSQTNHLLGKGTPPTYSMAMPQIG